jgi:hypothetical protein
MQRRRTAASTSSHGALPLLLLLLLLLQVLAPMLRLTHRKQLHRLLLQVVNLGEICKGVPGRTQYPLGGGLCNAEK